MQRALFLLMSTLLCLLICSSQVRAQQAGESLIIAMPSDWKVGFTDRKGDTRITEMVAENETVENWTGLITMQVFYHGLKLDNPKEFYESTRVGWNRACAGATAEVLKEGTENGFLTISWKLLCPNNPQVQKSEVTLFKAIMGHDSFYVVQRAWRGAPWSGETVKLPMSEKELEEGMEFITATKVCDTRRADNPCGKVDTVIPTK